MLKQISKRQKFVAVSLILSLGLSLIQAADISWRYEAIGVMAIATYFLSAWSLKEGLTGVEWLTVLILPTLFTAGIGLFFFLVPSGLTARAPVIILYAFGIYVLLLIENIFSVAAIRTIQLLRSAQAVGFLLTLAVAFFLYDTILSFRFDPWLNFLSVMVFSFPLILQGLWCINLEEKITRKMWLYTTSLSLALAELALAFSFWPVTVVVGSLALATGLYIVLGLAQHQLSQRRRRSVRGLVFPKATLSARQAARSTQGDGYALRQRPADPAGRSH